MTQDYDPDLHIEHLEHIKEEYQARLDHETDNGEQHRQQHHSDQHDSDQQDRSTIRCPPQARTVRFDETLHTTIPDAHDHL